MPTSLLWFRRDLRLSDHPALLAAVDAAGAEGAVVPVFVLDPRLWAPAGPPRRQFLLDCLAALQESLGGALVLRSGDPARVVPALVREVQAGSVHVSADAGPYGRRRDAAVEQALGDVPLIRTGSPYAVTPGRVTKADGSPFRVFTPFARAWRAHGWRAPAPRPDRVPVAPGVALGRAAAGRETGARLPAAGEAAALAAWARFRDERLLGYDDGPERPRRPTPPAGFRPTSSTAACTRARCLPTWRRSGPTARTARRCAGTPTSSPGGTSTPTSSGTGRRPRTRRSTTRMGAMTYDTRPRRRRAVRRLGRGPHRLPDRRRRDAAAARRGVGAQPGADDRRVVPREGPAPRLVARRPALPRSTSSTATWPATTTAGSGSPARAPTRRPTTGCSTPRRQGRQFDPDGDYVRRWVPELRDVPDPVRARAVAGPGGVPAGYPEPIVEHAHERQVALARYQEVRAGA